jgi:hypothetical protein
MDALPFGVHPDDEKVERNVRSQHEVGSLYRCGDGLFYRVVQVYSRTSPFGPRWDMRLQRISADQQTSAQVMLT